MAPAMEETGGIEASHERADFGKLEQSGSFGQQEAQSKLNGGGVRDQVEAADGVEKIAIRVAGGPGQEGNEGGGDLESVVAKEGNRREEIGAGVSFVEAGEHFVIERFDGGGDEETSGLLELRQEVAMLEEVFDLDGGVVGKGGELGVESIDDPRGVSGSVPEIGIAKGDVLRAAGHLLADIGENDFDGYHAKRSLINRNHGAMAAEVLTAAGGFGVADEAGRAAGDEVGIVVERHETVALRSDESEAFDSGSGAERISRGNANEVRFKLAAEDLRGAELREIRLIERRVEAIADDRKFGPGLADLADPGGGHPRGGVHG